MKVCKAFKRQPGTIGRWPRIRRIRIQKRMWNKVLALKQHTKQIVYCWSKMTQIWRMLRMHQTFGEPKKRPCHICISWRSGTDPRQWEIQVTLQHGDHAVIGGGRLLQRQGGQTGCDGRHTGSVNLESGWNQKQRQVRWRVRWPDFVGLGMYYLPAEQFRSRRLSDTVIFSRLVSSILLCPKKNGWPPLVLAGSGSVPRRS